MDLLSIVNDNDSHLYDKYKSAIRVDHNLNRQLVSYQAGQNEMFSRWYRYKESFSSALVSFLFSRWNVAAGPLLDPFAGSGTALFAAQELGVEAHGIELLPIGQELILVRNMLENEFSFKDWERLREWGKTQFWQKCDAIVELPELRITRGAYSIETAVLLRRFLSAMQHENPLVRRALRFVLLCVAESISYTIKDGQFLRWDYRAGGDRTPSSFDKGPVVDLPTAASNKIAEIYDDVHLAHEKPASALRLMSGSCLSFLPTLPNDFYGVVVTSPPYCNRYDYTRIYALELSLLGMSEEKVSQLRQEMLTCTVESNVKDLKQFSNAWEGVRDSLYSIRLFQSIIDYMEEQRLNKKLNHDKLVRMVRGYFEEMACVIYELYRVMRPGGLVFMVNDNVRYAGMSISVDLLLSEVARTAGFSVEEISVLPNSKGNSSQQMGKHGYAPLRKSVFVWKKPEGN